MTGLGVGVGFGVPVGVGLGEEVCDGGGVGVSDGGGTGASEGGGVSWVTEGVGVGFGVTETSDLFLFNCIKPKTIITTAAAAANIFHAINYVFNYKRILG
jgi:hypothetical protein